MINKTITLYFVIILSSFSLFSCSKDDDTGILNQRVNELVSAIENHDVAGIKGLLAKKFSTMEGLNKPQFLLFSQYHFKKNKNVLVTLIDKEISVHENKADITARVLLIGSSEWLPQRGQLYKVASRWKKESGDWLLERLRWEKE